MRFDPISIVPSAHAQEKIGAPAVGQGAHAQPAWVGFLPFVLIIAVFYMLVIRPQNKRYKQHKEMLAAVGKGDDVVTQGGLLGKVVKVEPESDVLHIEIAPQVVVKVKRQGVAERVVTETKAA
ncbi:MAG: preprotein translocase subunit YajC [Rickettsiales bacterium]